MSNKDAKGIGQNKSSPKKINTAIHKKMANSAKPAANASNYSQPRPRRPGAWQRFVRTLGQGTERLQALRMAHKLGHHGEAMRILLGDSSLDHRNYIPVRRGPHAGSHPLRPAKQQSQPRRKRQFDNGGAFANMVDGWFGAKKQQPTRPVAPAQGMMMLNPNGRGPPVPAVPGFRVNAPQTPNMKNIVEQMKLIELMKKLHGTK